MVIKVIFFEIVLNFKFNLIFALLFTDNLVKCLPVIPCPIVIGSGLNSGIICRSSIIYNEKIY